MNEMEVKNRFWVMKNLPEGNDFESALEIREESKIEIPEGCFATKNSFISMDAGTRMYMTEREDSYQPPIPIGEKLMGTVLGEIIESNHPNHKVGDVLRSYGQWSDYSVVDPNSMYPSKVDVSETSLENYVGIYGANGWTAYVGVINTGRVKAGDTFVVSAAAGCTGLMAGQIAKISGCKVIGIAGTDQKCDLICKEYGFDGAINYKTENIHDALVRSCPNGIDIYFDNVGGGILDECLKLMNLHGRIPTCGLISQYNSPKPTPGPYNYGLVLMHRLKIEGFIILDYLERFPEANKDLVKWMSEGKIKVRLDVSEGLENALDGVKKLYTGENTGKLMVCVKEI